MSQAIKEALKILKEMRKKQVVELEEEFEKRRVELIAPSLKAEETIIAQCKHGETKSWDSHHNGDIYLECCFCGRNV